MHPKTVLKGRLTKSSLFVHVFQFFFIGGATLVTWAGEGKHQDNSYVNLWTWMAII
jgi:hypothetical protein